METNQRIYWKSFSWRGIQGWWYPLQSPSQTNLLPASVGVNQEQWNKKNQEIRAVTIKNQTDKAWKVRFNKINQRNEGQPFSPQHFQPVKRRERGTQQHDQCHEIKDEENGAIDLWWGYRQ